jgi:hypothetical protein
MSIDLRDRIETSFGDGPSHRLIEERLDTGRRALRRRRLAATGSATAVVAALALTPAVMSHLRTDPQPTPVTRPSPSLVQSSSASPDAEESTTIAPGHTYAENPISREHSPVRFEGDRLVAKPGAEITARAADPVYSTSAVPAACQVRAVAVTDAATDLFVLGYICPHGRWDLFTETAGARAATLPAWLAAVKAAQDGGEGVR